MNATPLQELMFHGTGEAPPKTRILDECYDPVRAVQTYVTYVTTSRTVRREQPKVGTKKRPPVASFKENIPLAWLEVHLVSGGYDMYTRRQEQREIPRPSTLLRDPEDPLAPRQGTHNDRQRF